MPEHPVRPVRNPAKGPVTCEHDPALWQTAQLRYRDHLNRGGGIFYVGIPPDPDSAEAADWLWRSRSEIAVLPPFTFRISALEEGVDTGVVSVEVVTEEIRMWVTYPGKQVHWASPPNDPRDDWNTLNWPQAATALLASERMIHGWDPQWDRAISTTVAGRPGARGLLVLTLPWSDERSYGGDLQPHRMDLSTETAEVVIDDQRGVILEWNRLVDGQIFEHNAFATIDFDIALTDRDFDPVALGLTKRQT